MVIIINCYSTVLGNADFPEQDGDFEPSYVMSVRLSVHMTQLENHRMDLNEIWNGRCAIGDYPKIVLFNFLHLITHNADQGTCEGGLTDSPFLTLFISFNSCVIV
jgi:hypothetical protein